MRGNRTEALREESLAPRGSLRGPPKTLREVVFCDLVVIASVPLRGFWRSSPWWTFRIFFVFSFFFRGRGRGSPGRQGGGGKVGFLLKIPGGGVFQDGGGGEGGREGVCRKFRGGT